jgi:hypothetical protein
MNEMKNFFARHNRPSISRPCVTLCVARDERLHRIVSLCEQFTVNTPEFLSRFRVVAMCIFNEFGGLISSLPSLCQSHVEQVLSRPEFSNYIIPIGSIRIGDAQIRSLALKFVCDKLGIPCCVVRGPTPTDQDDETGSEACRGAFIRTFGCAQKMKRVLGTMETSCRFQLVSRVRRIRKSSYRKSGALILFKSRIALTTLHPTPRAFSCYCMLRRTRWLNFVFETQQKAQQLLHSHYWDYRLSNEPSQPPTRRSVGRAAHGATGLFTHLHVAAHAALSWQAQWTSAVIEFFW